MYNNIKSKIKTNQCSSGVFPCLSGVRQGANLTPLLFSFYLNDLETYFCNTNGIECRIDHEKIYIYLKLFVILYADDTVLLGDNPDSLKTSLLDFENYCKKWKLEVNISKTKVMVFGSRNKKYGNMFKFNGNELETVKDYKYLGLFLSSTNRYLKIKMHIAEQANKAMFAFLKKTILICRSTFKLTCLIK
jgi:hypothetical protein